MRVISRVSDRRPCRRSGSHSPDPAAASRGRKIAIVEQTARHRFTSSSARPVNQRPLRPRTDSARPWARIARSPTPGVPASQASRINQRERLERRRIAPARSAAEPADPTCGARPPPRAQSLRQWSGGLCMTGPGKHQAGPRPRPMGGCESEPSDQIVDALAA